MNIRPNISLAAAAFVTADRLTVGHRSIAIFVAIAVTYALQSRRNEAEIYLEQPSIL
jgi:hypothetical protein